MTARSEITMVMKDNQDLDPNRDIKVLIHEILIIVTLNKLFIIYFEL